jgi:hypothetical protein
MRGGVLKPGETYELSDGFGDSSRRLSFAYDATNQYFRGVYNKCGADGLVCNSDPAKLFTNDPTKLAAYNNFITVCNNLRGQKKYSPGGKELLVNTKIAFEQAFGGSSPSVIAQYMTEEQLNNFIDAKQIFNCFDDEQTRAEKVNQQGAPMYDGYCNLSSVAKTYGERQPVENDL